MPATPWLNCNQFARHHLVEAVDARDAVADRHDGADFTDIDGTLVVLDLVPQNTCNLVRSNLSHKIPFYLFPLYLFKDRRMRIVANWPRTDPSYTLDPIRAVTPPMRSGSTANRIRTFAPARPPSLSESSPC